MTGTQTQDKQRREKTVVGNLSVLDLRRASDESFSSISVIGNLGVVLYSRETAHLLSRIGSVVGNLGGSIEAPADAIVHAGDVQFVADYFGADESARNLVVAGRVVVSPDLPSGDIDRGLGQLVVTGDLICPDHLSSHIWAKTSHLGGQQVVYPQGSRVILNNLDVDDTFLGALPDAATLVVVGNLNMRQVVSDALLDEKLKQLQVTGRILVHEENAQAVLERLSQEPAGLRVTTIPQGHSLVDRQLLLDDASLASLPSPRLYCTRRVVVDPATNPELLDERLESLVCKQMVMCPTSLGKVMSRKCDVTQNQLVLYEGTLWIIEDERELIPSTFEYLEGQVTLLVRGVVKISPEIEPSVIADRVAKIHNWGVISCTPGQMGAVQARLGISSGVLADSTKEEAEDELDKNINDRINDASGQGGVIGNVEYLAL